MTDPSRERPAETQARLAFGALFTTLSATVGMVAGTLFAILIATRFGTSGRTDGFFVAYGVYGMFSGFAQGWRTTMVARLVESDSTFGNFNRYCGGLLLIVAVSGVVLVGLGSPVASVLAAGGAGAHETARTALMILWPAVAAQLFAGLIASMLGALGDFVHAARAYATGSIVGVLSFIALVHSLGIDAIATAVLINSVTTMVLMTPAIVRAGWRPSASILSGVVENARAAWLLVYSSLSIVGSQVLTVVTVSAATRIGTGSATLYSYANTGQGVVKSLVSMSLPVVLAAPLATTWNRKAASLRPFMDDALRTGLALLIPAVAAVAFLGTDVGGLVLTRFTDQDISRIVDVFLILSLSIAFSQAAMIQRVALMTLGRYGSLALLPLPQLVLHVPLCVAAVAIGSLNALAGAVAITFSLGSVATVALIHGRESLGVWTRATREVMRIALPAAACFGVSALLTRHLSAPVDDIAGFAGGVVLYGAVVVALLRPYRRLATRLVRSVRVSLKPA